MPSPLSEEALSPKRALLEKKLQTAQTVFHDGDSSPTALYNACSSIITDGRKLATASSDDNAAHQAHMSHILAGAYNYRGISLIQKDNLNEAVIDFSTAIQYNNELTAYYAGRGEKSYHDYQAPYQNRIYCCKQLGRSAEAAADEQTLATLFSNFSPKWVSDSELEEALAKAPPPERSPSPQAPIYSNDKAASAMLTIPEEPRPPTGEESYQLGEKKLQEEHYREALPFFDAAIEQGVNLDNAYYRRALCHYKVKHYEQAHNDLKSATQLNPSLLHDREVIDAYAAVNAELRKTWMQPLSQPSQPKPAAAPPAPKGWAALPPRPRQHAATAAKLAGHTAAVKKTMKDTPQER